MSFTNFVWVSDADWSNPFRKGDPITIRRVGCEPEEAFFVSGNLVMKQGDEHAFCPLQAEVGCWIGVAGHRKFGLSRVELNGLCWVSGTAG
jgi:hypothetical protein